MSLDRIEFYLITRAAKIKHVLGLKLIQLTLKVTNILKDLVCEILSEVG
jgi:hypothetical protein